jgi:hypothetical protein
MLVSERTNGYTQSSACSPKLSRGGRLPRFRFTIAELILVVVVAALGLAAIRSGSPVWAGAMFSITFFALICAFLGIALGRGLRRIYWSGFALLGWSYLLLSYNPWLNERFGQFLLAPNLFEYLDVVLHAGIPAGTAMRSLPPGIQGASATGGGFGGAAGVADLTEFVRIGIAMEALLWAFLGGWTARYFASGRDGVLASRVTTTTGRFDATEEIRGNATPARDSSPSVQPAS